MLDERLLEDMRVRAHPFALCEVADGWSLRMQGVDRVSVHFVIEGHGALLVEHGTSRPLRSNVLAVVPPHLEHALACGRGTHARIARDPEKRADGLTAFVAGRPDAACLRVACARVEAGSASGFGPFDLLREAIVLDFGDAPVMRSIFSRLLDESRAARPGAAAMGATLMRECLILVFRRLAAAPDGITDRMGASGDPRLEKVLRSILERPERPHSLRSLAAEASMSRSAFAGRFLAAFGRSPMAFVREVRIRRAAELLRGTTIPIDAVAGRVGFASRSHFSSAFRDHFGIAPARFRRRLLDGSDPGNGQMSTG